MLKSKTNVVNSFLRRNYRDTLVLLHHHNCMHSHSQGREFMWGWSFIVAQDMLQVLQTEEVLISTFQSLFLFNGVELNYHNIQGGDLNSRCAFVYALSLNFSGKLVVSAVLQSELTSMLSLLITWGMITEAGLRYNDVGTQILSVEERIEAPRRRTLRDGMSVPSTIAFHIVDAMFETICRITACQDAEDYSASAYKASKWHFGRVCVMFVWLVEVAARVCVFNH